METSDWQKMMLKLWGIIGMENMLNNREANKNGEMAVSFWYMPNKDIKAFHLVVKIFKDAHCAKHGLIRITSVAEIKGEFLPGTHNALEIPSNDSERASRLVADYLRNRFLDIRNELKEGGV